MTRLRFAVCAFTLMLSGDLIGAGETLTGLDGAPREATIETISGGEVTLAGGGKTPLNKLRRIDTGSAASPAAASAAELRLAGGGVLKIDKLSFSTKGIETGSALLERVSLPGGLCRAAILPAATAEARELLAKAEEERGQTDTAVALSKDKPLALACAVETLESEGGASVLYNGQSRKIGKDKLAGVVFAATGTSPKPDEQAFAVSLADGSRFYAADITLAGGKLECVFPGGGGIKTGWDKVTRIEVLRGDLVFLSSLEPVEATQKESATLPFPYKKDRSVRGNPLRLGEKTYDCGLGTHAACRLNYRLNGAYNRFAATIGIDAETGGKGDCLMRIFGDGKELFNRRVKGTDQPQEVKLDLAGVDMLTLAVEPGEDLDLADHADWCDARVYKE